MCRKYYRLILLVLLAALPGWPVLAADKAVDKLKFPPLQEIEMPPIEKISLDNGLIFYLLEDHSLPLINAGVLIAAGSYLDPPEKIGLADVTGTVMRTGGTASMTGDEIDEALEAIGASIEVNMDAPGGYASMNVLSEYLDTGVKTLADILRNPVFNQDKIDLAKTAERSLIARRNDDPWTVCRREYAKVIYGKNSPYARQTEYNTIDLINRNDLLDFHHKYITPENVMIAFWGDFKKDEMIAKINEYFGDWKKGSGKVPALPGVSYDYKPGIHYIEKANVNQTNIIMGHIGGYLSDPGYFAMVVMNNILGASGGGRLFNEVRSKQGLAYAVGGSYTSNISYPGVYYNYCFTKSESTVRAIKSMIEQIKSMQTVAPSEDEMRLGKDSYLNSFVFKFEDKGEIIHRMMIYDYFNFPNDFLFKAKANVEKVTAADVIDVARRNLHPDALQIVVVGNGADFDEPLSVLGEVDTIDISIPSGQAAEEIVINEETLAKGMELLRKAVEACGGIKRYAGVKSTSYEGTLTLVTPQGEFPLQNSLIFLLPDKSKEITSSPFTGEIIQVSDGDSSWVMQGGKVMDLPPERAADAKSESFRNTFRIFSKINDPDFQAVYVSSETLNGVPVDIIKIISLDGSMSFKLALDSTTHMPAAKMFYGQTMTGPANLTQTITQYKEVSGIMVPFAFEIQADGNKIASMEIKECKINPEIPENAFDKP
jgi:zinc protease